MLDTILGQLKNEVGPKLQSEAGVDSSQMDGIMGVVQSVAGEKIGKSLMGDGLSSVMNLFSDKPNTTQADTLQSDITGGIVSGLVEKLGFSSEKATSITSTIVPIIINLITKKNSETPDDDASPLTDLFGGGDLGGLADKVGGFFN
jgi:uncharacterized protein YidB (DUF937 family)